MKTKNKFLALAIMAAATEAARVPIILRRRDKEVCMVRKVADELYARRQPDVREGRWHSLYYYIYLEEGEVKG